jgi:hypothetical protein
MIRSPVLSTTTKYSIHEAPIVTSETAQADIRDDALNWGLAGGALPLVGAIGTLAMRRLREGRADEGVTLHASEGIVTMPVAPAVATTRTPLAPDTQHGALAAMVAAPPSPASPLSPWKAMRPVALGPRA